MQTPSPLTSTAPCEHNLHKCTTCPHVPQDAACAGCAMASCWPCLPVAPCNAALQMPGARQADIQSLIVTFPAWPCSCADESIDEIAAFLGVGEQVAALTAK